MLTRGKKKKKKTYSSSTARDWENSDEERKKGRGEKRYLIHLKKYLSNITLKAI